MNVLERKTLNTAHRAEHTTLCNLQYLIIIVVQKRAKVCKSVGKKGKGGCTGALCSFAVKEAAEATKTGPEQKG